MNRPHQEPLEARLRRGAATRREIIDRQPYPVGDYALAAPHHRAGRETQTPQHAPQRWVGRVGTLAAAAVIALFVAYLVAPTGPAPSASPVAVGRGGGGEVNRRETALPPDAAADWGRVTDLARGATPRLSPDVAWPQLAGATDWPGGLQWLATAADRAATRVETPLREEAAALRRDVSNAVSFLRDRWDGVAL